MNSTNSLSIGTGEIYVPVSIDTGEIYVPDWKALNDSSNIDTQEPNPEFLQTQPEQQKIINQPYAYKSMYPSISTFENIYPNSNQYNSEYQNYNSNPQFQNYAQNNNPETYANNSNANYYPTFYTPLRPDDVIEFINTQTSEPTENQSVSDNQPDFIDELNERRAYLLQEHYRTSPQQQETLLDEFQPTAPTLEDLRDLNPTPELKLNSIINEEKIEIVQPFVTIAQPPVENKPVFVLPTLPKTTADSQLPPLSYIDLAFPQVANAHNYEELCKILPKRALRDAVRHADRRSATIGKAEAIVHAHFKSNPVELWNETAKLKNEFSIQVAMSDQMIKEAEEVLDLYYKDPIPTRGFENKYFSFMNTFKGTHNFLQYVYEMAIAAKVEIESWDKDFAQHNWHKPTMLRLSINALERSLH